MIDFGQAEHLRITASAIRAQRLDGLIKIEKRLPCSPIAN
jgi:hypothetical protein